MQVTYRENCELALRLWKERVKPEQVVEGLRHYRCGTQACFGGHLATWPEFQAMGVTAYDSVPGYRGRMGFNVAYELFGVRHLFCFRDAYEEGTDHEVVVRRLERRLAELGGK